LRLQKSLSKRKYRKAFSDKECNSWQFQRQTEHG
ncbi:unnamed protein product, partial [marine sediment metagenome]